MFSNRIACGWKNCRETFGSILDMNSHVQMNHLSYCIQVQAQPFNRPDEPYMPAAGGPAPSQAYYPALEDVKPNISRIVGTLITLDDDSTTEDDSKTTDHPNHSMNTPSSSSSADDNSMVSPPEPESRRRAGRLSKYWIYDSSNNVYQCIEPGCHVVSSCSMMAVKHWQTKHKPQDRQSIGSTSSSTSPSTPSPRARIYKCSRRGCKKIFSTSKLAQAHYHKVHMNIRRRISAADTEQGDPRPDLNQTVDGTVAIADEKKDDLELLDDKESKDAELTLDHTY